jgi:midasin (ATPase involved in ribosome maturation)
VETYFEFELSFDKFLELGCLLYSRRFRRKDSQAKIQSIFKEKGKTNDDETNLVFSINDQKQTIKIEKHEKSFEVYFSIDKPFIVSQRVLKLWKNIATLISSRCPILVTGSEGSGKSLAVSTFTYLFGMNLTQICLTPESEPSILVGQFLPNIFKKNENLKSEDENTIKWKNGYVTDAF